MLEPTAFRSTAVLGTNAGQNWTRIKIGIEPTAMSRVIREGQSNLLSEKRVPYYAHFHRGEELIIVFPDRAFHVSPEEDSWKEAISYGESLGVPRAELDFRPCRFRDETF